MTLDDYLTNKGLTNAEFASLVGVDTTTILRVRHGKINPSLKLMRVIFRKTDEAVSPNDFLLLAHDDDATPEGAAA